MVRAGCRGGSGEGEKRTAQSNFFHIGVAVTGCGISLAVFTEADCALVNQLSHLPLSPKSPAAPRTVGVAKNLSRPKTNHAGFKDKCCDPRSSRFDPRCVSALSHLCRKPPCGTQQPLIAIPRTDELNADGQTVGALQKRQADRRHAAKRPESTKRWIAGGR